MKYSGSLGLVVLGMAIGVSLCCLGGFGPSIVFQAAASQQTAQEKSLETPDSPKTSWLTGTPEEKFAQIEKHLRGLDQSMAEIGYRYGELLLAAKSQNWEHAKYQTEKIDLSLRLALERRPKRAESSQTFLKETLPQVLQAIEAKNTEKLNLALDRLHHDCVECHKAENVLYFKDTVNRIKERSQ